MITEFLIQDRDNNLLATLVPEDCLTAKRDWRKNGFHTLELSVPVGHRYAKKLIKGNRILFKDTDQNKWYEFEIASESTDSEKQSVSCESSYYDTLSSFVPFVDITGNTPTNGLRKILETAEPKSRWQVGTTDIPGSFYMQRTRKSLKETISAWVNACGGVFSERIEFYDGRIVRFIDILKSAGSDRGRVIHDDREITLATVQTPERTNYTMAFGYGKAEMVTETGESKPITFAEVEWSVSRGDPVDKPRGQTWVALPDAYKEQYGILDGNGVRQHRCTVHEERDVEVQENLLQRTYDSLIEGLSDNTEYKIKASDFKALGYSTQDIREGDTIGVVLSTLNTKLKAEIIRFTADYLNPENNDFELANYTKDIIDEMMDDSELVKNVKDRLEAMIRKVFRQSILDDWNSEIAAESGFLIYGDPIDGLVCLNAPTFNQASKATRMKGGSLQIANQKQDGNWKWTTVLTGDGMIADAIFAGVIMGDRVEINLDTSEVLFGKRNQQGVIEDPDLYYGPDGLKIRFENNYVTEGEMSSAISMSASGLKQEFSATVSGVLAGNNNMLTGTALKTEENVWYSSTDGSTALLRSITNPIATSGSVINVVMMNPGKGKIRFNKNRIALKAGKTYTISAFMGTHMPSLSVTFGMTSSNGLKTVTIKERPAVYSHTFTPSVDDRDFTIFEIQMNDPLPSTGANGITFADIKLTESDQPTPWSPSAADLADELDAYSTTDEINSSIESRAAKLTKEFNTKLGGYPTTIEMNGAITTNAAGLTAQFNAKLTNYSSIMDMNSAIQLSASGLQANFNQKLTGYSNTTEMNTAIQASASGIMSVVSKKVNSSEVYTLIQQNAYAVKVAWNNNTKYVQLESAQFAIYDGTNRLISLGSNGMRLYRDDDGNPVGNIGTNKFKTDYSAKGLVFDLEPNGTYMGWAQRPNTSADSFTLLLTYCRRALDNLPEGLSVGCDLDMRWFDLKNVNLQSANLDGRVIVKSHGGVTSMGFVYYTNGTPQNYGYVEVATTSKGMVGIDAWQSDGRLKKNITPCVDTAVAFIDQIPVRSFDWKSDNSHEDYGLIAQELEALDENLVFKVAQRDDENNVLDEIYQIRPEKLIPPLIKSVQELKQLVDSQQQLINQLCENTGITTKMPPMARTLGIEPVTQYTDEIQIFKPETTKPETPKPIRYRVLDDATKEIEFIDESEETT